MTELMQIDGYATLIAPDTLEIKRLLPGPIERVWAYLTESDLRRQWLAAGDIEPQTGESFELVWRNDDLAGVRTGNRPYDMPKEHRMQSHVVAADPPRKLVIAWRDTGNVTFLLEPQGEAVLLTLIHGGFQARPVLLKHAAGWHAHLDVLEALAFEREPTQSFWDRWRGLVDDYESLIPTGE